MYRIAIYSPGKNYAWMTSYPSSPEEAANTLTMIGEGPVSLDFEALVKLAPASYTLHDGYRVTIDRLEVPR